MAWTTPRTWATSELVTAAIMNTHVRDNLNAAFPLGVDAWTAWTPTLIQSGAVSKTVTRAAYNRIGRIIVGNVVLTCSGSGTAGNIVTVSRPVAASAAGPAVGSGFIFDTSATLNYAGVAVLPTTTTLALLPTQTPEPNYLGFAAFNAALATGDVVSVSFLYEAAS
jgi:hypothetical protein